MMSVGGLFDGLFLIGCFFILRVAYGIWKELKK